jgi:hypothetical protein
MSLPGAAGQLDKGAPAKSDDRWLLDSRFTGKRFPFRANDKTPEV